jgi:hypothetical protein
MIRIATLKWLGHIVRMEDNVSFIKKNLLTTRKVVGRKGDLD